MIEYMGTLLNRMRPAFSRQATFVWFVVIFVGFIVRNDTFGVSSIVRALSLDPSGYLCLVHFFHSTAWSGITLLECWWHFLAKEPVVYRVGERIVLVGDHTKTPKDGRRMPEVRTLHQDSETASKPTFFRGHQWAFIALLVHARSKFFATPVWAEIHHHSLLYTSTTRIVAVAGRIAQTMGNQAYLVLDAFFAVGPVFHVAAHYTAFLHVLTRAKKNIVAYRPPFQSPKPCRGRPRLYGEKVHLMALFDLCPNKFQKATAVVYHRQETVRYLTLDLLWKPVHNTIRFFLIESSRGRIILMSSDRSLNPLTALSLYNHRPTIETMFDTFKNILGGMHYHFWSKYLTPSARRPIKNNSLKPVSAQPVKTKQTLDAIEKFNHVLLIVLGTLQLLACHFDSQIRTSARCWLRTPCGEIPSEFVTRSAISNIFRLNLFSFGKNWIMHLILRKQNRPNY